MKRFFLALLLTAGLFPSPSSAQGWEWCVDADAFDAFVEDGGIRITHDSALYNCCIEAFVHDVEQEGNVIRVWERELISEPCDCLCCYDLSATVGGVAPGDYWIVYGWRDSEVGEWRFWEQPITVPEGGEPGRADIVESYASDCLNQQSVPEPEESGDQASPTWGRIKSLFE